MSLYLDSVIKTVFRFHFVLLFSTSEGIQVVAFLVDINVMRNSC